MTTNERRRPRRCWVRGFTVVALALVLMVAAVYGWAWASLDRSSIARAMWWTEADVGDQFRFPARTIPAGDDVSPLPLGPGFEPPVPAGTGVAGFDAFRRQTGTLAFVVLDDDRLVYEPYFDGADRRSWQTSFSVAKSFLSTLVGIAIDEGRIDGVDDPVTKYVPELAETRMQGVTGASSCVVHDMCEMSMQSTHFSALVHSVSRSSWLMRSAAAKSPSVASPACPRAATFVLWRHGREASDERNPR